MDSVPPVTRRLLLRRFAAAGPVCATFVLPQTTFAAMLARHAPAPVPDSLNDPAAAPAAPPGQRRPIQEIDPRFQPHRLQAPQPLEPVAEPHAAARRREPAPRHAEQAREISRESHGKDRHAQDRPGHDPDMAGDRRTPRPPPPLVMLDPGHGGKDPGAIGYSGTYEKHVALAAAMELKHQLEAKGQYRVELTRSRDVFIPLDDRVALAERAGAALFVSMHADALLDHSVRGASVYTLAETPSDLQTANLARRENSADRFIGRHGWGVSPEVERVLANLVRRETRAGSLRMSRTLVNNLGDDLPMLPNPERHAGFAVLKAADIPSVLVEMGFMSNQRDEAALRRPEHRRLVAQAMHRAVDAYFAGISHMA